MKISMFFTRGKPQRRPPADRSFVELASTWTTRDWADLPVHHPRRD